MTKDQIAGHLAQATDEELHARFPEQINLLINMIRLSRLGGIATVECDDIPLRKRLFRFFHNKLRESNIYLYPVEVNEHDLNLVRLLRDLTERSGFKDLELIGRYENIALFVYGLEKFDAEQQEQFLASLNLFRDTTTIIKQPIIIWATTKFVTRMARESPDFWSWKGMLFQFAGNGHEAQTESQLPPLQRYLHGLMNDPDFAIWRDLYVPLRGFPLRSPPAWIAGERATIRERSVNNDQPSQISAKGTAKPQARGEPDNLLNLLARPNNVVVLGTPGAGKTTLLRYLAQAQARRAWKGLRQEAPAEPIPVFLRLNLMRKGRTFHQLIHDALLFYNFNSIEETAQLSRLLEGDPEADIAGFSPDQRFLFLCDGLGEVPREQRGELRQAMQRLLKRHYLVVTCRTEKYLPMDGMDVLLIEPLSDDDIRRYAMRYLGDKRGKQLAREVLDDAALTELARSPLVLYMLTRIADDSSEEETLPMNRGILFQRFTDNLLRRTEAEWWRLFGRTRSRVNLDVSRQALAELAYEMQHDRVTRIHSERCYWIVREATYVTPTNASAKDIFEGLIHSGIIRLSGDRVQVEFMHQAVREYFAALKIQESNESLASYLSDEAGLRMWGGTATLLFGIVENHAALYRDIVDDGTNYHRLWLAARGLATLPDESGGLAEIGRAVADDPHESAIFDLCRGLAYEGQGEFREAIAMFRRAIELDPQLAYAYYDLGCVFRQLGYTDYAIAAQKEAIRRHPEFVDAYNHLGITFFEQEDYQRALQVFEAAVELEPDNAHHYFNIGLVLQVLQQYKPAAQAFVRALQIKENYAEADHQLQLLRKAQETPNLSPIDQIDLFHDLPLAQRLALAQNLQAENAPAGTTIIEQGQPARRMYIIAEGEVEVCSADSQNRPLNIHRLQRGDHFSEAALLEDVLHSTTATAVSNVKLLSLSREHFDQTKSRFPALAQKLVQTRNARLQRDIEHALEESARRYMERDGSSETKGEKTVEREMTVLAACLNNTHTLTATLGPTGMLQFLQEFYLQTIRAVGENGLVQKSAAGEKVVVLFDEPLDAVRTALDMRAHFDRLVKAWKRKRPDFTPVGLGIGISTGKIALKEDAAEQVMAGTPALFADRLAERSAPEGEIHVDEKTKMLLGDRFENLIPLDKPVVLEGLDEEPVRLYRVPCVTGLENEA